MLAIIKNPDPIAFLIVIGFVLVVGPLIVAVGVREWWRGGASDRTRRTGTSPSKDGASQ